MRLIKASYEILPEIRTIQDMKRNIELGGRVCYKSENKITENSADKFIQTLIKSGHTSVLEHGTVYLTFEYKHKKRNTKQDKIEFSNYCHTYSKYDKNMYSIVNCIDSNDKYSFGRPDDNNISRFFVTTNYRVIIENGWLDDLRYWSEPTEYHEKRYTVRFICDRGVSHEFVRHRTFSFSQESTRYCNYSKDKFDNHVTYIIPPWLNLPETEFDSFMNTEKYLKEHGISMMESFTEGGHRMLRTSPESVWLGTIQLSESAYKGLLDRGEVPQQARAVLPNALKTELIMTGSQSQWEHFFSLRDAQSAHPQARELAEPLHKEFRKLGYVK